MFIIQRFSEFLNNQKKITLLFLLFILLFLLNFFIIPLGIVFHNSDNSIQPLWAERVITGQWSAFPFSQGYGGTTLSELRAFFLIVFSYLTENLLLLHFSFSYLFIPALILTLHFYYCTLVFNRATAFLSSLLICAYPVSWLATLGMDYYYTLILLGYVFLYLKYCFPEIWKIKFSFALPLGFIIGFSLYSFRGSIIYILLFLLPTRKIKEKLQFLLHPENKIQIFLLVIFCILLFLQIRIDLFGSQVGNFFGKTVKLHSSSNLNLTLLSFFLYLICKGYPLFTRSGIKAFLCGSTGFLLGASPEIFHVLSVGRGFSKSFIVANLQESLQTFLTLRTSLQYLLWGVQGTFLQYSFFTYSTLFLFLFSFLFVLYWSIKNTHYRVYLVGIFLCFLAYVKIYMMGPAESRYLYPLFPFIFILPAVALFEVSKRKSVFRSLNILLFFCIFCTCFYQTQQKFFLTHQPENKLKKDSWFQVTNFFEEKSLFKVVLTDAHLIVNTFNIIGHSKILYASFHPWVPYEAIVLSKKEKNLGILLSKICPKTGEEIEILHRRFKLKKMTQIDSFCLYEGESQN